MNIEQLRSFRAVATEGGFTKAADALYLAQSTVSMQVRTLERELGVQLFARLGRRVVLTRPGETMLQYATTILGQIEESRRAMAAFEGLKVGDLVVGASLTIGSYRIPELFSAFRRQHPRVRLALEIAATQRILEQVISGAMDLGLVEGPIEAPDLAVASFHTDELVLVVPAGHRWASREFVMLAELTEEPFVEQEPGFGTRDIVQGQLTALGIRVSLAMEAGSPEALKWAVRAGLGVAIVSRSIAELELEAGLLVAVPTRGLRLTRPLQTVMRRDRQVSPSLSVFLDLLHSSFAHVDEQTSPEGSA